jgi:inhibitor of the pro-sigma K processing machinery
VKTLWATMLAVSAGALLVLLIRRRAARDGLLRFAAHWIAAATAIYLLNFSGWISAWHIPLNPLTIGLVALLGIPGIALVYGLQWLLTP